MTSSSLLRPKPRRSFPQPSSSSWLLPKRRYFIPFLFSCLAILFAVRRGPIILSPSSVGQPASLLWSDLKKNIEPPSSLSYEQLQDCIDDYTSRGSWVGATWKVVDHPSNCQFQDLSSHDELAAAFRHVKIGFLGDSTTRSDLRAWETTHECVRTNLDETQVFQRRDQQGRNICEPHEQSFNLTKCGTQPIINVTNCPSGVSFRYFYKIYPWTPLDQIYLWQQPHLFRDLDVVVISIGRWFVYYQPYDAFNITDQFDTFLVELKKVFSGVILYQSEYPGHLIKSVDVKFPVPCTPHAICSDCGDTDQHECSQTDETRRPRSDVEMRSVLERHRILHLDRWNISRTLPLEYFQPWYCHNGTIHQWDCSHHLGIVALQHMRLIANVVRHVVASK